MNSEYLERQFLLENFRRYLIENPEEAVNKALLYLEYFLILSKRYEELEDELIITQNSLMDMQIKISNRAKVSLPNFL
ncbi:hypothetical protein NIES4102_42070 (plasmid) [Chondrocystis sp. NIES-4102]|nr:hypothetical protein NIES4102_42070 [Chondrocystis sp. NIES-4102]